MSLRRSADAGLSILAMMALLISGCATPDRRTSSRVALPPAPPSVEIAESLKQDYASALDLMRSGETDAAEAALQQLAQRAPALSGPPANLGLLDLNAGNPEAAIEHLTQAVSLNGRNVEAHNLLGVARLRAGQIDEARTAFETAIRIDPSHAPAQRNLGIMYDLYLGDPRKALEYYEKYQTLTDEESSDVKRWIQSVNRRLGGESE